MVTLTDQLLDELIEVLSNELTDGPNDTDEVKKELIGELVQIYELASTQIIRSTIMGLFSGFGVDTIVMGGEQGEYKKIERRKAQENLERGEDG